ncbi:MAG: hypothetical protein ACXAAH_10250 [Promethearchaeota archaeon]|jgi:hypothetical protein
MTEELLVKLIVILFFTPIGWILILLLSLCVCMIIESFRGKIVKEDE